MTQKPAPRNVICPTCRKPVPWIPESAFRPFCSERCRNIDLGAWAAEDYRMPEQDKPLSDDPQ
ncbi:MAG: DNA gyrase inhibitor YacG [Gallionellaceae bacterium]|nr:DNA gyrase inhibitor YacG [Gallionellaceae bacterium]